MNHKVDDKFKFELTNPGSGIIIYHIRKTKGIVEYHDALFQIGYSVVLFNDSVFLSEYIEVFTFIDSKNKNLIRIHDLKEELHRYVRQNIDNSHKVCIYTKFVDNMSEFDDKENFE